MRYIALLRGINVGGHNVPMEKLRGLFVELGLKNVRSYIQTGNVFFEADQADEEALASKIETHLEQKLGFAVPTCLRTVEELEQTLASCPYKSQEPTADERFCVVFSRQPIAPMAQLPLSAPKGDLIIVGATAREAFVTWRIINGRPPASGSNTWLEKTLGSAGTSRFYHTLQKILAAAKTG